MNRLMSQDRGTTYTQQWHHKLDSFLIFSLPSLWMTHSHTHSPRSLIRHVNQSTQSMVQGSGGGSWQSALVCGCHQKFGSCSEERTHVCTSHGEKKCSEKKVKLKNADYVKFPSVAKQIGRSDSGWMCCCWLFWLNNKSVFLRVF